MPSNSPSQTSTGFVNLNSYLGANQDAINSTANQMVGTDTAAAQKAQNEDNAVGQSAYNQAKAQGSGNTFDPTSVADYAQAQNDSQNAYQGLQGLTNGGLAGQVQSQFDQPGSKHSNGVYNMDTQFDTALMGNSANAQDAFRNGQNGFSGLNTYLLNTAQAQQAAGDAAHPSPAAGQGPAQGNPLQVNPTGATGGADFGPDYRKPIFGAQGPSSKGGF